MHITQTPIIKSILMIHHIHILQYKIKKKNELISNKFDILKVRRRNWYSNPTKVIKMINRSFKILRSNI